ncbi:hypothetical protein llap_14426 [Limosa lapponica baueri]|uniref:Uncharacterized protein n=1 Tax=Limosa lapponica baueri TaxID=1758121 RepID=A0A2I0TNA2_LIMLA|nr:hypothetical protein llap_14426 [Limosa lapponica baueri]
MCLKPKSRRREAEVQLVISAGINPELVQILDSVLKISTHKLFTNKYVNPKMMFYYVRFLRSLKSRRFLREQSTVDENSFAY